MELMDSWVKDIQGFDDRSASNRDLLSVQIREWFCECTNKFKKKKNMVNDSWLVVVDVHDKADSMAAASSS